MARTYIEGGVELDNLSDSLEVALTTCGVVPCHGSKPW